MKMNLKTDSFQGKTVCQNGEKICSPVMETEHKESQISEKTLDHKSNH